MIPVYCENRVVVVTCVCISVYQVKTVLKCEL